MKRSAFLNQTKPLALTAPNGEPFTLHYYTQKVRFDNSGNEYGKLEQEEVDLMGKIDKVRGELLVIAATTTGVVRTVFNDLGEMLERKSKIVAANESDGTAPLEDFVSYVGKERDTVESAQNLINLLHQPMLEKKDEEIEKERKKSEKQLADLAPKLYKNRAEQLVFLTARIEGIEEDDGDGEVEPTVEFFQECFTEDDIESVLLMVKGLLRGPLVTRASTESS